MEIKYKIKIIIKLIDIAQIMFYPNKKILWSLIPIVSFINIAIYIYLSKSICLFLILFAKSLILSSIILLY